MNFCLRLIWWCNQIHVLCFIYYADQLERGVNPKTYKSVQIWGYKSGYFERTYFLDDPLNHDMECQKILSKNLKLHWKTSNFVKRWQITRKMKNFIFSWKMSNLVEKCRILSKNDEFCRKMQNFVEKCRILSRNAEFCR